MRKNIFDIVQNNNSLSIECERIITLFDCSNTIRINNYSYTLKNCVNQYYFGYWKNRNHCIDVDDYLNALDYDILFDNAENNIEDFLTLIELIYNFWYLPYNDIENQDNSSIIANDNYYHLQKIMNDCLSEYNHKAYLDKENERIYVVEDKPEITAVAEIVNDELALSVIKYNHHTLKGHINAKKSILLSLGSQLEPQRKELSQINKKLSDNVFYLLNNLNLRHNNKTVGDKNYNQYVSSIEDNELEQWYDELYQMMLLCFLMLDNVQREEKIETLKQKMNGEN